MALLDLLMPPACAACGRFGVTLCEACIGTFRPPSRTGDRFVAPDARAVIGERLALALAAFGYQGFMRRALQRLKYAGAARAAGPLAAAAAPTLRTLLAISGPAVLVPVPLHAARERERGYNQARLLADALAGATGLRCSSVLRRHRVTNRQHGLDRAGRLSNLAAAFSVAPGERSPRVAILVDDILTTSATMEACALALHAAGAQVVYGLAIAREV